MSGTKIKVIISIIILALCLLFAGCSTGGTDEQAVESHTEWCEFELVEGYGHYTIYAHKKTGVCYLKYFSSYRCALTVMLNADGTPVTIEQIKGE